MLQGHQSNEQVNAQVPVNEQHGQNGQLDDFMRSVDGEAEWLACAAKSIRQNVQLDDFMRSVDEF